MAKKPQRKPDSARLAKLIIQRRTLALLLVFFVVWPIVRERIQAKEAKHPDITTDTIT